MRKVIALITGLIILAAANYAVLSRERIVAKGKLVLLELAPADPRSLMQGDYMALRFRIADRIGRGQRDGHVVLKLDEKRIGTFIRFDDRSPLSENEIRMRYRVRDGRPKFATNAFFFQEGDADLYANARYGAFRVAESGEAILTGLRGGQVEPLGSRTKE